MRLITKQVAKLEEFEARRERLVNRVAKKRIFPSTIKKQGINVIAKKEEILPVSPPA